MKAYTIAPPGSVDRARELRRNATDAERRLWRALREKLPGAKFRRQSPVGPYIADFLSFRHKLIVEVDGSQHADRMDYDEARTRYLAREGYQVIRFWNNDVLSNLDAVMEAIMCSVHSAGENPHPPAPLHGAGPSLSLWERGS